MEARTASAVWRDIESSNPAAVAGSLSEKADNTFSLSSAFVQSGYGWIWKTCPVNESQWYIVPVLTLTSEFLCFTHNDNVKLYLLEHSRAQLKYTTKVIIRKKSTQLRGILLYFISGPHKHSSRVPTIILQILTTKHL